MTAFANARVRYLGLLVLAWAAFASRRPDQWFAPQFWAEDGVIFFSGAVTQGGAALGQPYAGYLHLVPRLVAGIFAPFPWEYQPLLYTLAAGLIAAMVVVRVASSAATTLEKVLMAVAVVAVPHSGEVFLNLTNVNWILGVLLVLNLREPAPSSRGTAARRTAEVLLAGLSGPIALCLAPWVAWWSWRERRNSHAWPLVAAWSVAILVQGLVLLASDRPVTGGETGFLSLPAWLVPRYAQAIFVGAWWPYLPALGWAVAVVALAGTVVLFAGRGNDRRWEAALLLVFAVVLLTAGRAAIGRWGNPFGGDARYTYLPLVLLLWAFASLAAGSARRMPRWIALGLSAAVVASAASAWVARPMGDFTWPRQVREVREGKRTELVVAPGLTFPVPRRAP
jgi:hypothetical protein